MREAKVPRFVGTNAEGLGLGPVIVTTAPL